MTTQSLSSVAGHIVGQYAQASKHLVGAYRSGAQRLVNGTNTGYVSLLKSGVLPLVTDNVQATLFKVQTQLTGLVEEGINTGSNRAVQAIDFVAGGVNSGIDRVAAAAVRVEKALATQALTKVGQVAILPVAQVSLTIATRTAEGTKRLSARLAGVGATVSPVVAKAKRVVKKTVRRAKAARA
jgi:hypothetical protein